MSINKITELVAQLNKYRDEYYNKNAPSVSDAIYDRLFDELSKMEKKTGIILSNSPTQTVGYSAVSNLGKTHHPIPLLSLDKTKSVAELLKFSNNHAMLVMHKLDGLTLKLVYENGKLIEASTRGDGSEGEIVTHNIRALIGVPIEIPYKSRLVISGEGYILSSDFAVLKDTLLDSTGKPYKNARNLAAGSIRCLDAASCAERRVRFAPFNVIEGLDEDAAETNSKFLKLNRLEELGFTKCGYFLIHHPNLENLKDAIDELNEMALTDGIPIDGIVVTYNDIAYSISCGRTGHHYKDGIAYKFDDEFYETVLRSVEWNPSRFGEISPVAIFDTVVIDGTEVSRASLHNLSFIEGLQLNVGCCILISKRNMIIPHVEDNLNRTNEIITPPDTCPQCGTATIVKNSSVKSSETKTLYCENDNCPAKNLKKFVHFVSKKAMNIEGLSEATLEKFFDKGWLNTFVDIYSLSKNRDEIIVMEGFGEKSYNNMIRSIEKSRDTTFSNFLIAMDIPLVGRNASKILSKVYHNDLMAFRTAVENKTDFTAIQEIGEVINANIHDWFSSADNQNLWTELYALMRLTQSATPAVQTVENNPFFGRTVVVTGTLQHFSRDSINTKLESLGAKAGDSVSKKTDFVIAGDKAGSKMTKAQSLGVPVLTEAEFLAMVVE